MKDVFIVAAKRTPFGTYGGALANFTAIDLQEIASRSALEAGGINPEIINSVIVGSVLYVSVSSCIYVSVTAQIVTIRQVTSLAISPSLVIIKD